MKLTALLAAVGTAALLAAPLAQANEGEKLFRSNPCVACHMPSSPAVGPSLDQLAERYKGADEDTLNTVASHIVAGSGGVWGPIRCRRMRSTRIRHAPFWTGSSSAEHDPSRFGNDTAGFMPAVSFC